MEQAAHVSRLAHARMIGLLSLLWLVDLVLFLFSVNSILLDGPTVMIMFASEVRAELRTKHVSAEVDRVVHRLQYMILLAGVWSTTMKYGINCIDMRREVPWEDKSIYVFYVELAAGSSLSLRSLFVLCNPSLLQTFSSLSPISPFSASSSHSTASRSTSSATSISRYAPSSSKSAVCDATGKPRATWMSSTQTRPGRRWRRCATGRASFAGRTWSTGRRLARRSRSLRRGSMATNGGRALRNTNSPVWDRMTRRRSCRAATSSTSTVCAAGSNVSRAARLGALCFDSHVLVPVQTDLF